ncbi:MAG: hypothetical protein D6820_05450, partial [Lentisphaerae bacterium]
LKKLLAIQEKRNELLTELQLRKVNEQEKPSSVEESPDKMLKRYAAKKGPSPPVSESASKPSSADTPQSLDAFQAKLALLKKEQLKVEEKLQKIIQQRFSAQNVLTQLRQGGDEKMIDQQQERVRKLLDEEHRLQQQLQTIREQFIQLKQEFEEFIANESRNDFVMPGEKLELIVAEDKTFNGTYTVRRGGYIILPRIGRVVVAGKTRQEAELAVKKALEATQLYKATVLLEPARMDDPEEQTKELEREYLRARIKYLRGEDGDIGQDVIYLVGATNRTGPWPIPKNFQPTVLTTLIRSGGVKKDADLENVRLLRNLNGKTISERVNVKALMEGKPGVLDLRVNPNDIIVVPEAPKLKLQTVYVTGKVMKPGPIELKFDKKITVLTVILKAGGFQRFANRSKVYILREIPGENRKQRIDVDLKAVSRGEKPDVEVKPNDVIVVPESFWGFGG